jgi:N12 class adenine-specific DNA methylase/predicted RNA methylase
VLRVQALPIQPVAPLALVPQEPAPQEQASAPVLEMIPSPAPSQDWRLALAANAPEKPVFPPRLVSSDLDGLAGTVAKFEANLAAIEALARIEAETRAPLEAERRALLCYTGWGCLPAAFNLDGKDDAWVKRANRLQAALDADDYESARASVNNSHYTSPVVIEAMWAALERMGFTGGRVLEPAAGIGHFIGAMPLALAEKSRVCAVEIDRLSGRILRALYAPSGVDVHIAPFEKTRFSAHWFDLVIGNVPFGKYKAASLENCVYANFSIHNYFIARALDLVRPGGLVCLITSSHTMEASSRAVRQYLASQASLLGAIRLPRGTFAEIAGTRVQTDILFFRKREGAQPEGRKWMDRVQAPPEALVNAFAQIMVNEWFGADPRWLIGRLCLENNGYESVPTAVFEGGLDAALRARIALLPEGVYTPPRTNAPAAPRAILPATLARSGAYRVVCGRLHRVTGQETTDVHASFNATQRERISGMCAIRDCARTLLEAQLATDGDEALAPLRARLNGLYDAYVRKHGCLSTRANALAFRCDPDYPLLLSLEYFDEETNTARKAAMFTERTLNRVSAPTTADEPAASLAASMQWRGGIDPEYMAELLGAPADEVLAALALGGHIFRDPADERWKTADEYLSGNVRAKLQQARSSGPGYLKNVETLERVQPKDLSPAEIAVRLGAVWIPSQDVEAFVREVFDLEDCTLAYCAKAGAWTVYCNDWQARNSVKTSQEYGTRRMNAIQLVQCVLNTQTPTVKDRDQHGNYLVNSSETLAAREKLGLIKEKFASWAFEDMARRQRLCARYNELFNAIQPRKFDGAHLKLPGFSRCFELHPQQRNAIWRIVQSGNTGLFHAVGAGKTATNIIASMELRRLGFASKPCHVVPNHMLQQYTAEFVRLYPQASVLMATKEDLAGERRREFISRIATGRFDAIIITHASFERIKTSSQYTEEFIREVLEEIRLAILAAMDGNRSNRIVKQLELMRKTWQGRLDKLSAPGKNDDFLAWEQLGIDWLFIDEAHLYKNLFRFSKMRVAGLPLVSSERAFDLYVKTRYTMALHGERQRGVVFATATPVANTMAEVHTMMRYLQPARLAELGLQQFDAWAATFGESVTALEIAPDGSGYRMHTRFARFINIPELMAIFGEVADIQTAEMLKLPVPGLRGGKARTVTCPASPELRAFVQTLVARAENIRNGNIDPREDNMLAVTNDGRKAALDFRLISPRAGFDENGKVAACAREVHAIWQRTAEFRGAQLVFCDLSSPKGSKGFSVYEDLRERLIEAGIPAGDIAFIHDANTDTQKAKLFKSVREGRVRVLLGSTQKMGIGTNVQDRLAAIHELDAPWRPCDVEQREGRILRQGNQCEEVEIIRYVTENSFDAYSWQMLETKAKFIAQVMCGDKSLRSVEDVALATLSYAEVKALASGNPLVIEKAGVDAELAKLSTLHCVWRSQRYANEHEVAGLPSSIASLEKTIAAIESDLARLAPQSMASIAIEIAGRRIVGPEAVGETLRGIVQRVKQKQARTTGHNTERIVGRFAGLDLGIRSFDGEFVPEYFLKGEAIYSLKPYVKGSALVASLLEVHATAVERRDRSLAHLAAQRKRLAGLQWELSRPFEHEAKLAGLLQRQVELLSLLDITKDEAGTHKAEDAMMEMA